MKKIFLLIFIFSLILPLHSEEVSDAQEKFNIKFIKNSFISTFGREPMTKDYSRWLFFLNNNGEKMKMLGILRNKDEYLRKNKPTGIVNKKSLNVFAKPFSRSLSHQTLMAGDKFKIIGKKGEFYKISFQKGYYTSKGYVLKGAVRVIHTTQKISSKKIETIDIDSIIDKIYSKLTITREELLSYLLMDGKSFLFQYKLGKSILGEKSKEKYENFLRAFIINMKVKLSYTPFKFRGVLVDVLDKDVLNYDLLTKFDRFQKMGVNTIVFRMFNRGFTPISTPLYKKTCKLDFKQLMGRYMDEIKKRGLKSFFYMSGFNFGKNYEREFDKNMAINGLGFTTSSYYKTLFFADPILKNVREEFFKLFSKFISTKYFSGFLMSSFFYPPTPKMENDIRALFNFNRKSIRNFEDDTGLSMSTLNFDQEKILYGWLKNNQIEFFSELKKKTISYRNKLGIFLPNYVLNQKIKNIPTISNFSSNYYLINIKHLKNKNLKLSGEIIVYIGKTKQKFFSIEKEVIELKETYPNIIGWLIDRSN